MTLAAKLAVKLAEKLAVKLAANLALKLSVKVAAKLKSCDEISCSVNHDTTNWFLEKTQMSPKYFNIFVVFFLFTGSTL